MAALPTKTAFEQTTTLDPTQPLLTVRDLEVEYRTRNGVVKAVDKVSFEIWPNEVFGLAGNWAAANRRLPMR